MPEMSIEPKIGTISLDLMFVGSKSEAVYPVLHCDDGKTYRLHIQGNEESDVPLLSHLNGSKVGILGVADNLRGHWRLILDQDLEKSVILQTDDMSMGEHLDSTADMPLLDVPCFEKEAPESFEQIDDENPANKKGLQ